jgi:hypothetical protein
MNDTTGSNSGPASTTSSESVIQDYDPNNIPLAPTTTVFEAKDSEENSSNNFCTFEPNYLKNFVKTYRNIKVSSIVDEDLDRTYYLFDTFNSNPLTIMKFETSMSTLLSINDVVISLYDFLDIANIEVIEETTTADIRDINNKKSVVHCTTHNNSKTFKIPNATIPAITMALSVLSKEYDEDHEDDCDCSSYYSDSTHSHSTHSSVSHANDRDQRTDAHQVHVDDAGLIRTVFRKLW